MELFLNILLIIGGLTALYFGAEWLVKGASEIAIKVGISPLVVGLTVVAFGTSAPELLVCLEANAEGQPDVALGNIIGSNICNIALILGVAAVMKPIVIHRQIIRREMPILLVISFAFIAMLWNGSISRVEGGVLFVGVLVYVIVSIYQSKKEQVQDDYGEFSPDEVAAVQKSGTKELVVSVALIAIGLVVLKFGSEWLVDGGDYVARAMGVDEALIALFLFAFGTSLPELATSIIAVRKGEGDIITGNAVGSCIFNILAVIGITALVKPIAEGEIEQLDKMVMLGVTVGIFIFMWSRMRLNRAEGAMLLVGYAVYCVVRYQMG
ncbi:calcium/sodium antiporter [Rubritalea tangerina]|uniref:Calcium/sodium antiporter n=1 Tax=Rubritalea tangerina TaxID=430798 RepID=A0ABW4Z7K2_9BACT